MTDYDGWLAANDRFLSGALTWLRERLEAAAGPDPREVVTEPTPAQSQPRALFGRRSSARSAAQQPAMITPPDPTAQPLTGPPSPSALDDGDAEGDPPLLIELARRTGLTAFERNVLLLAIGMELDTRIPGLCARAHHSPSMDYPTFALALTLFDDPSWDALSPEGPLRFWQLMDVVRTGAEPLTSSRLRADDRVVSFVKGLHHLDERLAPLVHPIPETTVGDLAGSQKAVVDEVSAVLRRRTSEGATPPTVLLLGVDKACKRLLAGEMARAANLHLFTLSVDDLPPAGRELAVLARLWHRETLLAPVGLYLDAHVLDRGSAAVTSLRRWLDEAAGLVLVGVREAWPDVDDRALAVDANRPTPAEQLTAWTGGLATAPGGHGDPELDAAARRLTGQFDLDLATIRRLTHDTVDVAPKERPGALWRACLLHTRPVMDELAQRLNPLATWDDLQLPPQELEQLHQIADQVSHRAEVYDAMGFRERMNRGLGISVLFAGESGTGKTTAAEVLARDLDLLLYRIDLSAVVDKYIGETEKNLRRLFDAAEGGGAILFFDEADALFGKRSEVKDSHDRYANIEVNYLLQRLESYQGLAILATNRRSALDLAFVRRLRFIVTFPFPGVAQRIAMWERVFPRTARADRLDFSRLARLDLTGGSIQAIALNAAFRAAATGSEVTMPLVLDAARAELRKLDKPVNESDFRWLEPGEGSA